MAAEDDLQSRANRGKAYGRRAGEFGFPAPLVGPKAYPVGFQPPASAWDPQGTAWDLSQRMGAAFGRKGAAQGAEGQARGSLNGAPVKTMSIPPQGRALLATIGGPGFESNGTYTQRYNQPDFSDFSKHPNTYGKIESGPDKGLSSNAAGRYQFISTTYADQAKKQGLTDFKPESQDKAAWGLAQDAYARAYPGRNLAADLSNPAMLPQVANALRTQWSSLPGGRQPGAGMSRFTEAFSANLRAAVAQEQQQQPPSQHEPLVRLAGGLGG